MAFEPIVNFEIPSSQPLITLPVPTANLKVSPLSIELSNNNKPIFHFGLQATVVETVGLISFEPINNRLYLVKNGCSFSQDILNDLQRLAYTDIEIVDYALELETKISEQSLVIYCQQNSNLTAKDFTFLLALEQKIV